VSSLILNLGHQLKLAFQRRSTGNPVTFRQHANHFGVSVLRDLADEGLPISFGHPIFGLDFGLGIDLFLKVTLFRRHFIFSLEALGAGLNELGIHNQIPPNPACCSAVREL
jgi:hypothetical protein